MKPKEFDELIRQKFDQNDFAYKPRNWDQLAEQLDGRAKKRSIIMWWLMPVAGIAASVALAMGVTPMLKQAEPGNTGVKTEVAQTRKVQQAVPAKDEAVLAQPVAGTTMYYTKATKAAHKHNSSKVTEVNKEEEEVQISYQNAFPAYAVKRKAAVNLLNKKDEEVVKNKDKKKETIANEVVSTFKPEEAKKAPKLSVVLLGGYSQGNITHGYTAGASIRKMVTSKVYIESDVAFISSNNTQTTGRQDVTTISSGAGNPNAKTTDGSDQNTSLQKKEGTSVNIYSNPTYSVSYDLNYIQVAPSVGCKLTKRISIGAGPDFQRVLADKRPVHDSTYTGNPVQAPLFDIGLVGKTEYSVTKNVKAALSYRKGINNVLTPMDKYIDRDYFQFQVKCAIFNK